MILPGRIWYQRLIWRNDLDWCRWTELALWFSVDNGACRRGVNFTSILFYFLSLRHSCLQIHVSRRTLDSNDLFMHNTAPLQKVESSRYQFKQCVPPLLVRLLFLFLLLLLTLTFFLFQLSLLSCFRLFLSLTFLLKSELLFSSTFSNRV